MSFIGAETKGQTYAPGWFLANGDETCVRETRQIPVSMATTTDKNTKYVKMGSVYPANDGTAEGIVYEDVDVTKGDMPGSVVTKGNVYEDRLADPVVSYSAATPETGDNPTEKGWYERSGEAGAYIYTLSTDTTVDSEKTYYEKTTVYISSAAKTALTAKGFKFIAQSPAVTRPY